MYPFLEPYLKLIEERLLRKVVQYTLIDLESLLISLGEVDRKKVGLARAFSNTTTFFRINALPNQMGHTERFYYWLYLLLEFDPLLGKLKDLRGDFTIDQFDQDSELFLNNDLLPLFGSAPTQQVFLHQVFEALRLRHCAHTPPRAFFTTDLSFNLCMLLRDMEIFSFLIEASEKLAVCKSEECKMISPNFILADFQALVPLTNAHFQNRETLALIYLSQIFNVFYHQSLFSIADFNLPQNLLAYLKKQLEDSPDWPIIHATMVKFATLSQVSFVS